MYFSRDLLSTNLLSTRSTSNEGFEDAQRDLLLARSTFNDKYTYTCCPGPIGPGPIGLGSWAHWARAQFCNFKLKLENKKLVNVISTMCMRHLFFVVGRVG